VSKPKKTSSASDGPLYLEFKYCKDKCFACKQCGYFWGPDHKDHGKPAQFGTEAHETA